MCKYMSKIKEEFIDIIGSISVEELVENLKAQRLIQEIHDDLNKISIINRGMK